MADIKDKWPWPVNVGTLGTHPEEVKALQRRVEKNIDASPVPELAPQRLLAPQSSSDNLRMGEPQPLVDLGGDQTPVAMTHVIFRRLLLKLRKRGVLRFDETVDTENLEELPTSRREQMKSMLAREHAMLELIDRYNSLAEAVYMRLLSEAKG